MMLCEIRYIIWWLFKDFYIACRMKIILGFSFCVLSYAMPLNNDVATVNKSQHVINRSLVERGRHKRNDILCAQWQWKCAEVPRTPDETCCDGFFCKCNPFWRANCRCHSLSLSQTALEGCRKRK
ncbi:uncharacterized protein LOC128250511 isoform X2 [Octopus bimaculoides]|uniref:uncharacterized protein LOC128250511 isoform X2 n=1 Tax=Octopus bimaculoides TaxID=37653 RepID=UPI0022E3DDFB|nr:uncharacterized protein LOC128250511 isoform X2 [Octopus bimaculoides]